MRNFNVKVFSRKDIERYSENAHSESTILISISSFSEGNADVKCTLENNIKAIEFLEFDDIDREKAGYKAITESDAKLIAVFINKCIKSIDFDTILVNCGAGQSRSAGTAGAIMKYFNNDDNPIFKNPRYTPNMRCYRKVLEALYELNIK